VRDAIRDLKPISAKHKDKKQQKHWSAEIQDINLRRLRATPHNGGTRLAWKDNKELQLACYEGKDDTFYDVYGRMSWNLPAPTITTKFYSISNGRFGHPVQDRALSIREGADLQSFPRSYKFYSSTFKIIARMIGNAVPPELSRRIGREFVKNYSKHAPIQS
jgi:DNA (cytosine-5)-methyltransferase 1